MKFFIKTWDLYSSEYFFIIQCILVQPTHCHSLIDKNNFINILTFKTLLQAIC